MRVVGLVADVCTTNSWATAAPAASSAKRRPVGRVAAPRCSSSGTRRERHARRRRRAARRSRAPARGIAGAPSHTRLDLRYDRRAVLLVAARRNLFVPSSSPQCGMAAVFEVRCRIGRYARIREARALVEELRVRAPENATARTPGKRVPERVVPRQRRVLRACAWPEAERRSRRRSAAVTPSVPPDGVQPDRVPARPRPARPSPQRRVVPGAVVPRGVVPRGRVPRDRRPRRRVPGGALPRGRVPETASQAGWPSKSELNGVERDVASRRVDEGLLERPRSGSAALICPPPRRVDLADAVGAVGAAGTGRAVSHQGALDLVGRPVRMRGEELRRRARDDRSREGGARELHVAGRDDVVGLLGRPASSSSGPGRPCSGRARRARASRSRRACSRTPTTGRRRRRSGVTVPWSAAPTVITNGSLPGA